MLKLLRRVTGLRITPKFQIRLTQNQVLGGAIAVVSVIAAVALIPALVRLDKDQKNVHKFPTEENKREFDVSLERVKAIGGGITTIATIAGGIVLFLNFRVSQDKQLTERFSKAVEQLGSDKDEVRLGGIYSLERIARNSPADHWTIMEVLTSFVRRKSPMPDYNPTVQQIYPFIEEDIQAALTVIGRRKRDRDPDRQCINLRETNLSRAYLERANFQKADLRGSSLQGANLCEADFSSADLSDVDFAKAFLDSAIFTGATLTHAKFNKHVSGIENFSYRDAKFDKANLWWADFSGANLLGADFQGAKLYKNNFTKADLRFAQNLDVAKLETAILDGAQLPPSLGQKSDSDNES